MRIAFVGIKRPYSSIDPTYIRTFNKYHLEFPLYFAELGGNECTVTTVDFESSEEEFASGGTFKNITESSFAKMDFDVVVHWRAWHDEFYRKDAFNVLHTCDHTYDPNWKSRVISASDSGKLGAILCYAPWHLNNLFNELGKRVPITKFVGDATFGVDCETYRPTEAKDPFKMLWSSDPGRGLQYAVELAISLFRVDKRFRLHVCYPDYVKAPFLCSHPAIVVHGCLKNGPELWDLFATSSIMPYTSVFKEPSARVHRQAQAAGCVVLYPPNMGTPSDVIRDGATGYVRPVDEWNDVIAGITSPPMTVRQVGMQAREFAKSEDWNVISGRFSKIIEEMRRT